MGENIFEKAGTFAQDAAIDTAADGAINSAIDGVASHVPGGGMVDGMMKTGVDLEVNNFINSEIGKVEGGFGRREPSAPPDPQSSAAQSTAGDTADTTGTDDSSS